MIWYDMICYVMLQYDMIGYDIIWYDMLCYVTIWFDAIYDIIHDLTSNARYQMPSCDLTIKNTA